MYHDREYHLYEYYTHNIIYLLSLVIGIFDIDRHFCWNIEITPYIKLLFLVYCVTVGKY